MMMMMMNRQAYPPRRPRSIRGVAAERRHTPKIIHVRVINHGIVADCMICGVVRALREAILICRRRRSFYAPNHDTLRGLQANIIGCALFARR